MWIGSPSVALGVLDQGDQHAHRLSPSAWIDWSTVVSGGSVSADSGMLSNPTTDRSSGTGRPSSGRCASPGSPTGRWRRRPRSADRRASSNSCAGARGGLLGEPADARRARGRTRCRPRRAPRDSRPRGRRADSRSGRPARNPIRRCPSVDQVRGRRRARLRSSGQSIVGSVEPPTCGSTATTGCRRGDLDHGRRDEDDAVGERAAEARQVAPLPALAVRCMPPEYTIELEAGVLQRLGGALQQLGAERLDVRHEDADHVRALAAQAPGDQARLVAELVDHVSDPFHRASRRRRTGR